MVIKTIIRFLVILIVISSCNNNPDFTNDNSISNKEVDSEKDDSSFGLINNYAALTMYVQMRNCGEWGGNREYYFLERDSNEVVNVRFQIDTISCDEIIEKDDVSTLDSDKRIKVYDTVLVLTSKQEILVFDFISYMFELKLSIKEYFENTCSFYLNSADSTIFFSIYNVDYSFDSIYMDFKRELFGESLLNYTGKFPPASVGKI